MDCVLGAGRLPTETGPQAAGPFAPLGPAALYWFAISPLI